VLLSGAWQSDAAQIATGFQARTTLAKNDDSSEIDIAILPNF